MIIFTASKGLWVFLPLAAAALRPGTTIAMRRIDSMSLFIFVLRRSYWDALRHFPRTSILCATCGCGIGGRRADAVTFLRGLRNFLRAFLRSRPARHSRSTRVTLESEVSDRSGGHPLERARRAVDSPWYSG